MIKTELCRSDLVMPVRRSKQCWKCIVAVPGHLKLKMYGLFLLKKPFFLWHTTSAEIPRVWVPWNTKESECLVIYIGKYVCLFQSEAASLILRAHLFRRACEVKCSSYWCMKEDNGEGKNISYGKYIKMCVYLFLSCLFSGICKYFKKHLW